MSKFILFWRRTDVQGLERLELNIRAEGITANAAVICEPQRVPAPAFALTRRRAAVKACTTGGGPSEARRV
jgi:hypothetical protein